jgi:hypothetical protein
VQGQVPAATRGFDLGLVTGQADVMQEMRVQAAQCPARPGNLAQMQKPAHKAAGVGGAGPKRLKAVGDHGIPPSRSVMPYVPSIIMLEECSIVMHDGNE